MMPFINCLLPINLNQGESHVPNQDPAADQAGQHRISFRQPIEVIGDAAPITSMMLLL
jgi:hypothetical protein